MRFSRLSMFFLFVAFVVSAQSCSFSKSLLEKIKEDGELIVVTRNAESTYYEGPDGEPRGLEYELAQRFAERLGVKLKIVVANNLQEIFSMLLRSDAHLAAAGLTITEKRKRWVNFAPPYQYTKQQLVYKAGLPRPRSVEQLQGKNLEVVAHSSYVERLQQLKLEYPDLNWTENNELDPDEMLELVRNELLDYTVIDSVELQLMQRHYPELRVAFDLSQPEPMAWAFPHTKDNSLYIEAIKYFNDLKTEETLDDIIEEHYGHVEQYDYVGTFTFKEHILSRLPSYEEMFRKAGEKYEFDWRLLSAVGYQESHWNAAAVSPTGVRGIMMLTKHTARYIGVKKRTDPAQSIDGGARYLRYLVDKVDEKIEGIEDPDRIWFALASYNIGFGHLEDARIITQRRGGNPNKWIDVKDNLPLLRKRKWYRKTRHGYARGNEAVKYVENIRSYYEILTKAEEDAQADALDSPVINAPAL